MSRNTISVEMDADFVENLVRSEIDNSISWLQKDLESRQSDADDGMAIFSTDKEEDIRLLTEMIEAFEKVRTYY